MWIFAGLVIMIVARLSPIKYLKKIIGYSVIPFSLSSSNAAIPFTLDFCNEELGIDSKGAVLRLIISVFLQSGNRPLIDFIDRSRIPLMQAMAMP